MATIKVRYLVPKPGRRRADGSRATRHFWQPSTALRDHGWQPLRLSDDEARAIAEARARNQELDAWRTCAEAHVPVPQARTVDSLIADYKTSRAYLRLAPSSKIFYNKMLAVISKWIGDKPVTDIDYEMIELFYEQLWPATPDKANAIVTLLHILDTHAQRLKWRVPGDSPARLLRIDSPRRGIRPLWTPDAVRVLAATADDMGWHSIGTAAVLNEWIGQRPGDLVALSRQVYSGGALTFYQNKTDAGVPLPIDMVPHLYDRLGEQLARQAAARVEATTLLARDDTGLAWTVGTFREKFAEVRDAAAKRLPEIHQAHDPAHPVPLTAIKFRHFRHTAVTRLGEAGVDNKAIAAISGHSYRSIERILEIYMVRTAKLARTAFRQRMAAEAKEELGGD